MCISELGFMCVYYMYVSVCVCLYISKCIYMCMSTLLYLILMLIRKSMQFLVKYKMLWISEMVCELWNIFFILLRQVVWNRIQWSVAALLLETRNSEPLVGQALQVLCTVSGSETSFGSCLAHWAFLPGFLIRKLEASCCLSLGSLVRVNMGLRAGWGAGGALSTFPD